MTLKSSLRGLLLAGAGMSLLSMPALAASDGKPAPKNTAYIVQLAEQPVSAYAGGVAGYAATKPRKGQKINPNDPQVYSYMGYLAARHDSLLSGVGGGKKLYSYGYVFNGFAAELTEAQALKLALTPGVLAVSKDEIRQVDTASTPSFSA
jgi:Peptidase inhibitor I9